MQESRGIGIKADTEESLQKEIALASRGMSWILRVLDYAVPSDFRVSGLPIRLFSSGALCNGSKEGRNMLHGREGCSWCRCEAHG